MKKHVRQQRVAELTMMGLSKAAIAEELGISVSTVAADRRAARSAPGPVGPSAIDHILDEVEVTASAIDVQELASTARGRIVAHLERIEALAQVVELRLVDALRRGFAESSKVRDFTWCLGVLSDKLVGLGAEARKLAFDDAGVPLDDDGREKVYAKLLYAMAMNGSVPAAKELRAFWKIGRRATLVWSDDELGTNPTAGEADTSPAPTAS